MVLFSLINTNDAHMVYHCDQKSHLTCKCTCADPETFAREGLILATLFVFFS